MNVKRVESKLLIIIELSEEEATLLVHAECIKGEYCDEGKDKVLPFLHRLSFLLQEAKGKL